MKIGKEIEVGEARKVLELLQRSLQEDHENWSFNYYETSDKSTSITVKKPHVSLKIFDEDNRLVVSKGYDDFGFVFPKELSEQVAEFVEDIREQVIFQAEEKALDELLDLFDKEQE